MSIQNSSAKLEKSLKKDGVNVENLIADLHKDITELCRIIKLKLA
jgi:hypothetical protein